MDYINDLRAVNKFHYFLATLITARGEVKDELPPYNLEVLQRYRGQSSTTTLTMTLKNSERSGSVVLNYETIRDTQHMMALCISVLRQLSGRASGEIEIPRV